MATTPKIVKKTSLKDTPGKKLNSSVQRKFQKVEMRSLAE